MKKTLVLGATPNPIRFSHKAVKSLIRHGHEVVPIGIHEGDIMSGSATAEDIETLIGLIVERVEEVHGVRLVREVRIVGRGREQT